MYNDMGNAQNGKLIEFPSFKKIPEISVSRPWFMPTHFIAFHPKYPLNLTKKKVGNNLFWYWYKRKKRFEPHVFKQEHSVCEL